MDGWMDGWMDGRFKKLHSQAEQCSQISQLKFSPVCVHLQDDGSVVQYVLLCECDGLLGGWVGGSGG